MTKVALKGLLGRKLRTILTAFAIVLGVAMVSGTYVLTDTIKAGFNSIFTVSYENSDAVITGETAFGNSNTVLAPSFPVSVLGKVRGLPEVAAAEGGVSDAQTHLVGSNGKVISTGGAPNLGFSIDAKETRFNPLTLVEGRWLTAADEIGIDAATARKHHYGVGDTIGVSVHGPTKPFKISGIAELGGVASIGGATLAVFDLPTAQKLFQKVGKLDQINVARAPNVSNANFLAALRAAVPPDTQVKSGTAQAKSDASDTTDFLGFLQNFLLAFGFIALFVGAFVIGNTLSITIAQRTREFATLRTIGASRRQVLGSVMVEALVIGVVASLIGLGGGFLLAKGLNSLFVSFGIDLPTNGTVFATRTVVVSMLVGVIVTLVASLRPAIRATRVPPIAAVREGSILPQSRLARFGPVGAAVVGLLGIAGLLFGAFGSGGTTSQRLIVLGLGVLLLFIGVAMIAPRIVKPIAAVVGPIATWAVVVLTTIVYPITLLLWLVRRGIFRRPIGFPTILPDRVANDLAGRNTLRSPARTASTAAALMIGLALVTFVAVLATGLKSTFENSVHAIFRGDYALTSQNGFTPTDISSAEAVRKLPEVTVASGVRAGEGKAFGKQVSVTAVDPGASQVVELDWTAGSQATLENLGENGAFVSKSYAKKHGLELGSPIEMLTPYRETLHLKIHGIFDPPPGGSPFGTITMSSPTFDSAYPQPQNVYVLIKTHGGVTPENTKALEDALTTFPDAKIQTEKQFEKSQEKGIDILLNLLYVLLGFSILISLFGIVNTLVLTVFERTRELGMLRAVGMTRIQVRRMIRHEAVITALIGAALGIPLGIFLALLIDQAVDVSAFAVPWTTLIVFVIAAVIAGIIAAIFPARRAARLNVLQALQYE